MRPVRVRICVGTTCTVMGASELQMLEEHVDRELRDAVAVEEVACLGHCKDGRYGQAPYVEVDGEVLAGPSLAELVALVERRARRS